MWPDQRDEEEDKEIDALNFPATSSPTEALMFLVVVGFMEYLMGEAREGRKRVVKKKVARRLWWIW